MNEKRIQQVLEIEQQAQSVYQAAINEAKQLPAQAEQDAQLIIEKARSDAEQEASRMMSAAQAEEETTKIQADADEKVRKNDILAQRNFSRAVADVLCRIVGKE